MCAAARASLAPELYNRIDEVLAYGPLGRAEVGEVAKRMLRILGAELERTRDVRLDVSAAAVDALLDGGGFDPELGARPMRRAIGRLIEAPIAEMILRGELERGGRGAHRRGRRSHPCGLGTPARRSRHGLTSHRRRAR